MKTQFLSCKYLFTAVSACLFFANTSVAQKNGIIPLTGIKFFNEGITAKLISVRVDGGQLMSNKIPLNKIKPTANTIVLIGPEGDFTPDEIHQSLQNNFTAVNLGNTRLRTETAGVVAATLLMIN